MDEIDYIDKKKCRCKGILIILPFFLFFLSFLIGRYPISPIEVITVILSKILPIECDNIAEMVIFQIRIPRIIAAMLVGAGLSISGASFQGLFKNPLVSPDILGVSAGASLGASIAILLSLNLFYIQIFALLFGLTAVAITYFVSRLVKSSSNLVLVLSGVAVGSLFSALTSFTKYVADPYEKLPAIVFWLMGSLSSVSNKDLLVVIFPMLVSIMILLLIRWKINVISIGDEEARSLGLNTKKFTTLMIICCTILTASAVCISGIIGWVGLVIPHIGRMIVGPDHRKLLPATLSLGASYLLLVDNFARALTTVEIPLGILTAIMGAPFFIYLLKKSKIGWS
ncbi:FecCD family ABC transporter permease [Candidatus Methanoliparum sp. LAM-1]|uniref:FecCD family ABC transporter permease n=1 Tax=Candidatus Methanoliparum sp. LAM-1 TaxID=2874846 RepID=UPI001E3F3552|nr:iron ABC transporter permease [Candidatus Methanoliparum sp. LAM-1]